MRGSAAIVCRRPNANGGKACYGNTLSGRPWRTAKAVITIPLMAKREARRKLAYLMAGWLATWRHLAAGNTLSAATWRLAVFMRTTNIPAKQIRL